MPSTPFFSTVLHVLNTYSQKVHARVPPKRLLVVYVAKKRLS